MLTKYIQAAMRRAHYEMSEAPRRFYGEIEDCQGVWATGATLEECREELESALEDWILFRLTRQLPVPAIDGTDIDTHLLTRILRQAGIDRSTWESL